MEWSLGDRTGNTGDIGCITLISRETSSSSGLQKRRYMTKKIAVLSDIHGNLSALEAVMGCINTEDDLLGIILLGDLIDYGMRSNEVIEYLNRLKNPPIMINIWGNHEKVILEGDFSRLSSERGRICAAYTKDHLTERSKNYLLSLQKDGMQEFTIDNYKCLAIHGSLEDEYWRSILPESLNGIYKEYDIVFSGHSHYPHTFQKFYLCEDDKMRNKKSTLFINPGSVGQPRNHNPKAQFAILDIGSLSVSLHAIVYDIKLEQSLYPKEIDKFYSDRLERGV